MKNPNVIVSSKYGPIIINRYDNGVGKQISQLGYFSESDVDLIRKIIAVLLQTRDSITFYDVGANVGTHSLAIAKSFEDRVKIRAFEAQRFVYYMLCGTVAINGLENVSCHLNVVSDVNNLTIDIKTPDYNVGQNFGGLEIVMPPHSDNQDMHLTHIEKIDTVTIDSYGEQVDFLKMDIEGMEDKALQGAVATFERSRPIVFLEILKTDVAFCLDFMRRLDYRIYQKELDVIGIPAEMNLDFSDLKRLV